MRATAVATPPDPPEGVSSWFRKLLEPSCVVTLLIALGGAFAWLQQRDEARSTVDIRVTHLEQLTDRLATQTEALATQSAGNTQRLNDIIELLRAMRETQQRH
jgi:hypothetical protein